jgi:hypothetical protein
MAIVGFFFSTLSVFSCWWMTITLLRAWWVPLEVENGAWVKFGIGVMIMELLIMHSGTFMGGLGTVSDSRKRYLAFAGLAFLYTGAAFMIAHEFHSVPLLYSFGFIMLSRLLNSFHKPSKQEGAIYVARSATSGALYILLALFSVVIPWPAGGITPEILNHVYPERGSGIWQQEPQRALAVGAIYFFCMGLFELMVAGGAFNVRSNDARTPL